MKPIITLLLGLCGADPTGPPAVKPVIQYTLRVDSADLSGWDVTIQLRGVSDTFRLAMAAHPEYDDRYWRYVTGLSVTPATAAVTRVDSAVWQIVAPRGDVQVRYRTALPPPVPLPRAAWRPFLTPTGGLIGGPHAFMYLLGAESLPVLVTLELPKSWDVATSLVPRGGTSARTYSAASAAALIDSPILTGRVRQWRFESGGASHRVVYWPLPDATPFDTGAFVGGIRAMVGQAIALFGRAPYREYTFQFQDGAYGGLEHANSVSLGARSEDLARDPQAVLRETAHEFVHTWNLMQIRPVEYRDLDYRTQPPVASLWFSEGLTIFYADLLLRRAGLPVRDSTRIAHLERALESYLGNPAYARFSAEAVSRVAYNAEPGALGDYGGSTHQQGEILGTMLDLIVRDATQGRRSMDDVMRALFARTARIDANVIENAVQSVCACDVTPFFTAYVRNAGELDFNRYLGLIGMNARVDSVPAVRNGEPERDLRIFGWEPPGDGGVRLVVNNPMSIWGRAGLHSGDRLVTIDGAPIATWPELRARLQRLRLGDTVRIEMRRPAGVFAATVIVTGFERPRVRIERTANAIGEAWISGKP